MIFLLILSFIYSVPFKLPMSYFNIIFFLSCRHLMTPTPTPLLVANLQSMRCHGIQCIFSSTMSLCCFGSSTSSLPSVRWLWLEHLHLIIGHLPNHRTSLHSLLHTAFGVLSGQFICYVDITQCRTIDH